MTFVFNNFEKAIPFIGHNVLKGAPILFELLNSLQNRTLRLKGQELF